MSAIKQSNEIIRMTATRQAPPPSKDFIHLQVTEEHIKLTVVPVNPRCLKFAVTPKTNIYTFLDFLEDTHDINKKISELFPNSYDRVCLMAKGHIDPLTTLPNKTLIDIISNLNLEDVENLSQVSGPLSNICNSNQVWEILYEKHLGRNKLSSEMKSIANEMGWKKFYFSRKINTRRAAKKTVRRASVIALDRENSLAALTEKVKNTQI
jgi:F-box protein 36